MRITSTFYKAFIIFFIAVTFVLVPSHSLMGKNYYFSNNTGDDARTSTQAQNPATPWKSISKLNSFFVNLVAGDSVLFKRGETFYGSIVVAKSGTSALPIVIGAYGSGAKPVITGFTTLTSWTSKGNGIFESAETTCKPTLNMVTVNGKNAPVGRFPNTGYLKYESRVGITSITDNELTASPNWTGAEVVIRKKPWVLDRNLITNHTGSVLTYTSGSSIEPSINYGYFFQRDIKTLDLFREWYFNPTSKKLNIFFGAANPALSLVKASSIDILVNLSGRNYITFDNLSLEGANVAAFYTNNSISITIKNCVIAFSGTDAISVNGSSTNFTLINSIINHTNNIAINISTSSSNANVSSNTIKNTAIFAGLGMSGTTNYSAINSRGANALLKNNTIDSTGYIGISFNNNNSTITENYINYFCSVLSDGGGIYTASNSIGNVVSSNIVINGIGAIDGTSSAIPSATGIYLDDRSTNITVSNNTVSKTTFGLYLHNSRDINVKGNTLYDNGIQLYLRHDNIYPNDPIRNVALNDNIFVAKHNDQLPIDFNSRVDDFALFGTANRNYYIDPFGFGRVTRTKYSTSTSKLMNETYSYNRWKAEIDRNALQSPIFIPKYIINNLIGSNKYPNGTFDSNVIGMSRYYTGTSSITWDNTNMINGGSARSSVSVLSATANEILVSSSVVALDAGKNYILRFSSRGVKTNRLVKVLLIENAAPYRVLSSEQLVGLTTSRIDHELVFSPSISVAGVRVSFKLSDSDGDVYFDNIQLFEANVTTANIADHFRLEFNASSQSKTIPLNTPYIGVDGTLYASSITLLPHTSAVLIKNINAPSLPPNIQNQNFQINENSINGTTVGTVVATASKTGQTFAYSIVSGNSNGAFSINSSTGVITVSNSSALNFEVTPLFELTVKVTDNLTPTLSSQAVVSIRLTDINEKPIINNQAFSVVPNAPNGTVVEKVLATDSDAGQTLTYSILSGNINNAFVINASTGVLTVATSSALNLQTSPIFTLAVNVRDNGVGNLNSQATITINLTHSSECSATGNITYEVWNNIGTGGSVSVLTSNINYPNNPTSTSALSSMEAPINLADNFGARIVGFICAPATGSYTFWIASDDNGELWLSTNDQPANKQRIAYHTGYTWIRTWNKYPTQKSAPVNLVQGQRYYIEAIMKDATGGDNLAVGWLKPGQTGTVPSEVIPGSVLSPLETILLVTSVSLPSTSTVTVGSTVMLLPTVLPENAFNSTLAWTSSNTSVATVNSSGLVTGISLGTATITATSTDGSNKSAICSVTVNQLVCSAEGSITYQVWNNIGGGGSVSVLTSNINYPNNPTSTSVLSSMEAPVNLADNFGARIVGYICAPATGSYTFWIASDDNGELWLSTNDQPANKQRIAYHTGYTWIRTWNKYPTQKSVPINLIQGQKYYIEAIMKDATGVDNMAVGWLKPGQTGTVPSEVIPGSVLSPLALKSKEAIFENNVVSEGNIQILAYPNPLSDGMLNIKIDNLTSDATLKIYSIAGVECHEELIQNSGTVRINRDVFKSGIYIVKVYNEHFVKTVKLIVK